MRRGRRPSRRPSGFGALHRALLLGLAAALLAPTGAGLAQDFDTVTVRSIPVAPGLHMLTGRGGNVAVSSGPDGVVLIDDQYAPLTEKIVAAVREISDGPIRFVINTHWHADHTGGNENLGRAGAVLVAHERVRQRMSAPQFVQAFRRKLPPSPPDALPVVTFSRSIGLHLNGIEMRVEHVETAHTDGDAIVHFRGLDAVHAGDVYVNGFYPFIDVSSEGSIDGTIAAVRGLLASTGPKTKIIPGHGPLSNRAELASYHSMLRTVRERIAAAVARGEGADAVVAARPTADLDPRWGDGFLTPEAFVRIVHADLSRPGRVSR